MATFSSDTAQPFQVKGLAGHTLGSIFTVGDKIGTYIPAGILDGIGAFELNPITVRLYVTPELANAVSYKYTLKNSAQLPGAREFPFSELRSASDRDKPYRNLSHR